jgi:hypothetical protein
MQRVVKYEDIRVCIHRRSGSSKWQFYYYDSYGERRPALSTGLEITDDNYEQAIETARMIAARELGISHPYTGPDFNRANF